jgi:hypothetical protein
MPSWGIEIAFDARMVSLGKPGNVRTRRFALKVVSWYTSHIVAAAAGSVLELSGLVFRIFCFGFGISGLGFGVRGLVFRVSDFGFGVSSFVLDGFHFGTCQNQLRILGRPTLKIRVDMLF